MNDRGMKSFRRRYASTKRRLLNPELQEDISTQKKNKIISLFLSLSLFRLVKRAAIAFFNKTRSVNNADATTLELIYTQRKRHGHVGRA